MEGEFRSWRLSGILATEIAAGNSVFKESHGGTMNIVVLERAYMTPIRPDDGVIEYREQTFDPGCFKMVYYDRETNEYLGFKAYHKLDPLKAFKELVFKKK